MYQKTAPDQTVHADLGLISWQICMIIFSCSRVDDVLKNRLASLAVFSLEFPEAKLPAEFY